MHPLSHHSSLFNLIPCASPSSPQSDPHSLPPLQKRSKKIGEDSDDESSALAAAKTEKSKKQKALKIKLDGVSKASKDAGAKKIIYDDDGEAV